MPRQGDEPIPKKRRSKSATKLNTAKAKRERRSAYGDMDSHSKKRRPRPNA